MLARKIKVLVEVFNLFRDCLIIFAGYVVARVREEEPVFKRRDFSRDVLNYFIINFLTDYFGTFKNRLSAAPVPIKIILLLLQDMVYILKMVVIHSVEKLLITMLN